MEGFINLHRQILESEVFASEKGLKIWIWILLKANYRNRFVPVTIGQGQSTVELKRGSLLFGRFSAEESLGISGSTVYKWLKKFEEMKMISIQSNSHFTIITILNFNKFNDFEKEKVTANEQPSDSQVTTKYPPTTLPLDTDNKDKKDKKGEKENANTKPEIIEIKLKPQGFNEKELTTPSVWHDNAARALRISSDKFRLLINEFILEQKGKDDFEHREIGDLKKHSVAWAKKRMTAEKEIYIGKTEKKTEIYTGAK